MPETITAYRVFIASPGGLEEVRKAFRSAIDQYNQRDAMERGVLFLPIGWEITLGGVGRPQAMINEDVRRCDYFILVLHDRWGSAPQAGEGLYTSGSEEEFDVARECHQKGTVRQILVFFKEVSTAQLKDPGDQLKKVLDFRQRLEAEKSLLFGFFEEVPEFDNNLQKYLARWVRDHEREAGGESSVDVPPATAGRTLRSERAVKVPRESGSAAVRDAAALARAGHVTQAERALAQVIAPDQKPKLNDETFEAMVRYGSLQLQKASHAKAEEVFKQLRELAHQRGVTDWEVAALNNLGQVYQAMGQPHEAEETYREALTIREQELGPNHPEVAVSLNLLADFLASQFRYAEAERLLRRALEIQQVLIAS